MQLARRQKSPLERDRCLHAAAWDTFLEGLRVVRTSETGRERRGDKAEIKIRQREPRGVLGDSLFLPPVSAQRLRFHVPPACRQMRARFSVCIYRLRLVLMLNPMLRRRSQPPVSVGGREQTGVQPLIPSRRPTSLTRPGDGRKRARASGTPLRWRTA